MLSYSSLLQELERDVGLTFKLYRSLLEDIHGIDKMRIPK